jgi:hypothetical protein
MISGSTFAQSFEDREVLARRAPMRRTLLREDATSSAAR